jgi:acetyl-CoA synthetase
MHERPGWRDAGEPWSAAPQQTIIQLVDEACRSWPGSPAMIFEDGLTVTYAELLAASEQFAGYLAERIQPGDAVAVILRNRAEFMIAWLAVVANRAVLVSVNPDDKILDAGHILCDSASVIVILTDEHESLVQGLRPEFTSLREVITVCGDEPGGLAAYSGSRPLRFAGAECARDDITNNNYTSGTTGKPKGAVHTHAGFLVKTASEVAYSFDLSEGGVFCWITDMGWIMGPLSIIGTHANGGTLLLYEGSPDVPDLNRLWDLVQRHGVTMLGVSPTLIRTLRTTAQTDTGRFDLSSVHTIGSTGEPWDPDSYEWLARDVFGARVPVINFSGGTEVGGSFLAPYPVEPIRSCSLGGPSLGMDVDVIDDQGHPVRGVIGELICRQPWPSMTRGIWKDPDRYLEAYWSTFPGVWRHGDYALVEDEQWYILGRSDDVMNVAGKRLAPAEVESIMTAHEAVAEVAVVGVPDAKKGEAVWAFWVPRPDATDDVSDELRDMVARELGKPFAPSAVLRVAALPKTRSAKIMRRAVRAAVMGTDPGDLSGAENPDALEGIQLAAKAGRP